MTFGITNALAPVWWQGVCYASVAYFQFLHVFFTVLRRFALEQIIFRFVKIFILHQASFIGHEVWMGAVGG